MRKMGMGEEAGAAEKEEEKDCEGVAAAGGSRLWARWADAAWR